MFIFNDQNSKKLGTYDKKLRNSANIVRISLINSLKKRIWLGEQGMHTG